MLWALPRDDLFAPALAGVGLHPDRLILAVAGRQVLSVMEEGLRHRGLAGVVGELEGRLTLTASRRLQLAAEASGVIAIVLRRASRQDTSRVHAHDPSRVRAHDPSRVHAHDPSRVHAHDPSRVHAHDPSRVRAHDDPVLAEPNAAVTRWRLTALPSPPPLPRAPLPLASDVPGLGRARWRLALLRCRGGEPASWIVEACDATGHLALVAELPDRSAAPLPAPGAISRRAAG